MEKDNDWIEMGDNNRSVILLNKKINSMRFKSKDGNMSKELLDGLLTPLGVARIMPGLYIELGRTFSEFREYLNILRKPLILHKVSQQGKTTNWRVIRLSTGKIPEVAICSITVIDDIIVSINYNPELVYNSEYTKYLKVNTMMSIVIGTEVNSKSIGIAIKAVATVTKLGLSEMNVKSNQAKIMVMAVGGSSKYAYNFTKGRDGKIRFMSMGYAVEVGNRSKEK